MVGSFGRELISFRFLVEVLLPNSTETIAMLCNEILRVVRRSYLRKIYKLLEKRILRTSDRSLRRLRNEVNLT